MLLRNTKGGIELDKVVIEGLKLIKNDINLSTGFSHPGDKASTIDLLRKLKQSGYLLNSILIRDWALENEFNTRNAETLKDFVDGVNAGKGYRIQPHWKENIITILEQRAESE